MKVLLFITGVFFILWVVDWLLEDSKNKTTTEDPENLDKKNYDRLLKKTKRWSLNKKVWRSKIPYARLISEIVYFTKPILREKKIKNNCRRSGSVTTNTKNIWVSIMVITMKFEYI